MEKCFHNQFYKFLLVLIFNGAYFSAWCQTELIDSLFLDYSSIDSIIDPFGNVTQLSYNEYNLLQGFTDSDWNATQYSYDEQQRLSFEQFPDGNQRQFLYDSTGVLAGVIDVYGDTTTYLYNTEGLLVRKDYPGDNDVEINYNNNNQMTSVLFGESFITYEYDFNGRVASVNQSGQIINYAYDDLTNRRTITYPSGRIIEETRDSTGRLMAIRDGETFERLPDVTDSLLIDSLLNGNIIANFEYDPSTGQLIKKQFRQNNSGTRISYDEENRIKGMVHMPSGFAAYNSMYDGEGNLTLVENLSAPSLSEQYSYDTLNRMTEYRRGFPGGGEINNPNLQKVYEYSAYNNRVESQTTGEVSTIYTTNGTNGYKQIQLGDSLITLDYDRAQNVTFDGRFFYLFDIENRLKMVAENNGVPFSDIRVKYTYDALGRRIRAEYGEEKIYYIYDEDRIIEEQDENEQAIASYVYDPQTKELLSMRRNNQDYYYHYGVTGSVVALTDSTGQVVERYNYDPYGNLSINSDYGDLSYSTVGNPYTFGGMRLDEETYLYEHHSQFFNSELGRSLNKMEVGHYSGAAVVAAPKTSNFLYTDISSKNTKKRTLGLGSTEEKVLIQWAKLATNNNAYSFNSGDEFMQLLEMETTKCNCLDQLTVISHGWGWPRTKGQKVNGGVYGTVWINGLLGDIPPGRKGKGFKITPRARSLKDLELAMKLDKIKFCKECHIVLTGCRVGSTGNFVYRLASMTGCTVLSSHGGCSGTTAPLFTSGPKTLKERNSGEWKGFSLTYPDGRQKLLTNILRLW